MDGNKNYIRLSLNPIPARRSIPRVSQTFIYALLESAVNYCHEYPDES